MWTCHQNSKHIKLINGFGQNKAKKSTNIARLWYFHCYRIVGNKPHWKSGQNPSIWKDSMSHYVIITTIYQNNWIIWPPLTWSLAAVGWSGLPASTTIYRLVLYNCECVTGLWPLGGTLPWRSNHSQSKAHNTKWWQLTGSNCLITAKPFIYLPLTPVFSTGYGVSHSRSLSSYSFGGNCHLVQIRSTYKKRLDYTSRRICTESSLYNKLFRSVLTNLIIFIS